MPRHSVWRLAVVLCFSGCSLYGPPYCPDGRPQAPPPAGAGSGPLHAKALDYDRWYQGKLRPEPYGGVANVIFADASYQNVIGYDDLQDSAIWTGTYLAAEAFRYATVSDPEEKRQALGNARAAARTLDFFLHVTQTPGLIARFAAPLSQESVFLHGSPCCPPGTATDPANLCCSTNNGCTTGTAPDGTPVFWLGGTSRDQYSGWFYGMGIAERLIDDPELRQRIRDDMTEIVTALHDSFWIIRGPDGKPSGGTAAFVEPYEKLSWLLSASAAGREPACGWYEKEVRDVVAVQLTITPLGTEWLNQYMQYYGFNLNFINYYNLVRLEPNGHRRRAYLDSLNKNSYRWVRGSDNVFFDYTAMALRGRANTRTLASDRQALSDFPGPPNYLHPVVPPPAKSLNPFSLDLYHFNEKVDPSRILFAPRAESAYPLNQRCPQDFLWQQSPFMICCQPLTESSWIPADLQGYCNGLSPLPSGPQVLVYPGADYLLAYWMGRYYGFLRPVD
ncbi:MAG TPA: hypothetical protein VLV54_14065 [Thermoanaerobaculia bacterium]|nr:hypothetical protein [Thermoanaerobaculia bacterium]